MGKWWGPNLKGKGGREESGEDTKEKRTRNLRNPFNQQFFKGLRAW